MEPLPATRRAAEELGEASGPGILRTLLDAAERVRVVVPECVGISLATLREGLTFTVVATSAEVAALDAVQYLDGGPCVEGARHAHQSSFTVDELLDEGRWHLFARASAATGVASTLTLPILDGDRGVGSVNLYGFTPDAFDGHHDELAEVFDAWAPGAVTNADLSFETQHAAAVAPAVLQEQRLVNHAAALVARTRGVTSEQARSWIRDAALRAGSSESELARLVVDVLDEPDAG